MILARKNLKDIPNAAGVEKLMDLPERVLQFGTGVLLRGLTDYFVDKANRQGMFNGRVVVVKSTSLGNIDTFAAQDNLFTLCIKGNEQGKKVEDYLIISSISRVVDANKDWSSVLQCMHQQEMRIIVSNTTEVGIVLADDDVYAGPPSTFPGKLLACLLERFKVFDGSRESGMIIIPTELIPGNADRLRSILLELAIQNKMDQEFMDWVGSANHFCNSLVDRIVPGKLNAEDRRATEARLGYEDNLMIMAENFRLWAIESRDPGVTEALSFANADEGVVIAPDIERYRELKLRLLNGTHTFTCGLAFLAGFETVKEGLASRELSFFVERLALDEIIRAVEGSLISKKDGEDYARTVFDRFRNPYIEHPWINITLQYSSKMRMRNIPLLQRHYNKTNQAPEYMALGFAGFLLFMKCRKNEDGKYKGYANLSDYVVQDDNVAYFSGEWEQHDVTALVHSVLSNKEFWGLDLSQLNGFEDKVTSYLESLLHNGVMATIRSLNLKTTIA